MITSPSALSAPDAPQESLPAYRPRKLRLLYVATTRHYGGLELAAVRLAQLLMQTDPQGIEVVFACRPGMPIERDCREAGIPTCALTIRNSADIVGALALRRLIARERIDIVHVHSRRDYVPAVLAIARTPRTEARPRLLLHMHLLRDLGSPKLLSGYFFSPNVDRFVAVSSAVRRWLLESHPQLGADQVIVAPNSVDIERFRRDPLRGRELRAAYGISDQHIAVGMVGRLDAKGQSEVIQSVASLRRHDVHLLLVGAEGDRGTRAALEGLAERLGIADRVVFCGPQQDVPGYLSAMDIFVHLPIDEAFGLAPAEAMAAATPTIVSNVGGCVELVSDGRTGLVVDPLDQRALAHALSSLIDSPELRDRLAHAGCEYVRERFTTRHQALAMLDIYRAFYHRQRVA